MASKDKSTLPEPPDLPEPPEFPSLDLPDIPLPEPPEIPTPPMPSPKDITIPTPFGKTHLQTPEFPSPKAPKLDNRRKEALKHVIASDVGSIVGFVPVVGDIVADIVEDLHGAELRKLLTPSEKDEYAKQDKVAPSTLALIRTFAKTKK